MGPPAWRLVHDPLAVYSLRIDYTYILFTDFYTTLIHCVLPSFPKVFKRKLCYCYCFCQFSEWMKMLPHGILFKIFALPLFFSEIWQYSIYFCLCMNCTFLDYESQPFYHIWISYYWFRYYVSWLLDVWSNPFRIPNFQSILVLTTLARRHSIVLEQLNWFCCFSCLLEMFLPVLKKYFDDKWIDCRTKEINWTIKLINQMYSLNLWPYSCTWLVLSSLQTYSVLITLRFAPRHLCIVET